MYEFDRSGEYCYYYAHLDRYADGLTEGMTLNAGQAIGYVGTTGKRSRRCSAPAFRDLQARTG